MTHTDFIRNRKLSSKFNETFIVPKFTLNKPILAVPNTKNYTLIGTAFDYLLRFFISRNNTVVKNSWICEDVVGIAKYDENLKETVVKIIKNAKGCFDDYNKSGFLTESMVKSVIRLAKLDGIIRSGGLLPNSIDIEQGDIEDLNRLYSIIPRNVFKINKLCVLNPSFGTASSMVGGADADLVLGDTLIDIKTTTTFKFPKYYFLQLIGYYVLNDLAGINGLDNKIEIKKLGIYYSRFGYLFSFNVEDVVSDKSYNEFKEIFIDIAQGFK